MRAGEPTGMYSRRSRTTPVAGAAKTAAGALPEALLEGEQRVAARAELVVGELAEGGRDRAVDLVKVGLRLVDVEQAGDHLAAALPVADVLDGRAAVARVVVLGDLAQQ